MNQPMLAPRDPSSYSGARSVRHFIQAADRDFGFALAQPCDAAAAGRAEASVGIGAGVAALLLVGLDRPDGIGGKGRAAALSAVGAVADADAKRIAAHAERHAATKTAAGADWRCNMVLHDKSPLQPNGGACRFVPTDRGAMSAKVGRHADMDRPLLADGPADKAGHSPRLSSPARRATSAPKTTRQEQYQFNT